MQSANGTGRHELAKLLPHCLIRALTLTGRERAVFRDGLLVVAAGLAQHVVEIMRRALDGLHGVARINPHFPGGAGLELADANRSGQRIISTPVPSPP